jgi:hypothetical protein
VAVFLPFEPAKPTTTKTYQPLDWEYLGLVSLLCVWLFLIFWDDFPCAACNLPRVLLLYNSSQVSSSLRIDY